MHSLRLNSVAANLTARFILDLRSAHHPRDTCSTSRDVSSIQFNAPTLTEAMSAVLVGPEGASFVSRPADDDVDNSLEAVQDGSFYETEVSNQPPSSSRYVGMRIAAFSSLLTSYGGVFFLQL